MAELPCPFSIDGEGILLRLRVQPKAKRGQIGAVVADGQGNAALKVAVTAAPERGKANAAVIALLAKSWRLRKSDLFVVQGETDRNKLVRIAGDGNELAARLLEQLGKGCIE